MCSYILYLNIIILTMVSGFRKG